MRRDNPGPRLLLPAALLALTAACAGSKPAAADPSVRRYEGESQYQDKDGSLQKVPFEFEDRQKAVLRSPQGGYQATVIERSGMLAQSGTLVYLTPAGGDLDMGRRISEGLDPARDPDVVFAAQGECALEASWVSESRLRLKVPAACRTGKRLLNREALTISYE